MAYRLEISLGPLQQKSPLHVVILLYIINCWEFQWRESSPNVFVRQRLVQKLRWFCTPESQAWSSPAHNWHVFATHVCFPIKDNRPFDPDGPYWRMDSTPVRHFFFKQEWKRHPVPFLNLPKIGF